MTGPLICFDWDGTIADSMELCLEEMRLTMERMGLPQRPRETYRLCNGPSLTDSMAIVGVPAERAEEYIRCRRAAEVELIPSCQKLFPGVKEMLTTLKGQCALAIVSNGYAPYVPDSIAFTGLDGIFAEVRTGVTGRTKAQLLRGLLSDTAPTAAIMIGDRLGDFDAGHDCGLKTVACRYGYGNEAEWREADASVGSAPELLEYLRRWLKEN